MSPHPKVTPYTQSSQSPTPSLLPLHAQGTKPSPVGHLAPSLGAGHRHLTQLSPKGKWQYPEPCGLRPHDTHTGCRPLPRPGSNSILCLLLLLLTGHGPQTRDKSDTAGGKVPDAPCPPTSLGPCWGLLHPASHTLANGTVTQQSPGREATWRGPVPATEAPVLCPPELMETAQASDAVAAYSRTTWAGPCHLNSQPAYGASSEAGTEVCHLPACLPVRMGEADLYATQAAGEHPGQWGTRNPAPHGQGYMWHSVAFGKILWKLGVCCPDQQLTLGAVWALLCWSRPGGSQGGLEQLSGGRTNGPQ